MSASATVHELIADLPRERRSLLPALQAVQHAHGWLSREALAGIAEHLRVPASEVWGVASDYPELRLSPTGAHHVRVCTGVSCRLVGGTDLLAGCRDRFRGRDAEVTVEEADCFFTCSMAPLLEVDGAYRGRVAPGDVAGIERWFQSAGHGSPTVARPPAVNGAGSGDSAGTVLGRLVAAAQRRRAAQPSLRLMVGAGSCARSVDADAVAASLRDAVKRLGVDAEVVDGACNGMCYAAPVVEVQPRGDAPRWLVERVDVAGAARLLESLAGDAKIDGRGIVWSDREWRGLVPVASHPFWRGQERVLLRRAGAIDPNQLDDALLAGAYSSLATALDASPERVIEDVRAASLQGRGGAFFPTAVKWEAARKAAGAPKYLVMNGEEGEPGIFKDRHLMEADPHQILEGALIAAYAAGASHVILYIHGEANLSADRMARAVADATAAGIVAPHALGGDWGCTVEIRRGAGGFVLGEETALLESIEGRRAQPRTRPPFPVESGLWGCPTVINNVETLATVPVILERGPQAFVALGTAKAAGTKLFGLSGPIARPGVVETRHGVTLRHLLVEIAGGLVAGGDFLGAVVGGPSGSIIPAALFDVAMEPRERVSPGTGGIVGVPRSVSVVDVVTTLLGFNARESCGKCTPCREGAPRLLAMIDELRVTKTVEPQLRDLAEAIQLASLCGLGQAAPLSLMRALEDFREAF